MREEGNVTWKYGPLSKWKGNWITGQCHILLIFSFLFIFYSIFLMLSFHFMALMTFISDICSAYLLIFIRECFFFTSHRSPMIFIKSMKAKVSSIDKNKFFFFFCEKKGERESKEMDQTHVIACVYVWSPFLNIPFTQYWFYCY